MSSKIFLASKMFFKKVKMSKKIIQFSEAEVAVNSDITPIGVHVQRFTGYVYDWSILNDWPIQTIDLLTSIWGSLWNIAERITHAVPTSKRVKPMVKVRFSVLIYQIFKAFKETIKYTLFKVTIARLKFWKFVIFRNFRSDDYKVGLYFCSFCFIFCEVE